MTNSQMHILHDRATRGDLLTDEERAQLDTWYLQQDQAELGLLQSGAPSESVAQLREQVAAAAAQLESISQQIRSVLVENEQVRSDIALLQSQRCASHPARRYSSHLRPDSRALHSCPHP